MLETASSQGIWRYAHVYSPAISTEHRLTLGEGGTPLVSVPALANLVGVNELLLKRDDLSPGGSHKARSLAYRMSLAKQRGERNLVISSSGNAAVAASMYAAAGGLRLIAFMSRQTPAVKLQAVRRESTVVVLSERPRNLARYASRTCGLPNLTPSLDDASIEGFKSIACEIAEQTDAVDAVFTFATSGSSLLGMARQFGRGPSMHAVQAGAGSIAAPSDPRFQEPVPSLLAGLLGIEESPRAEEARRALADSGGRGWVQTDAEILWAVSELHGVGVDTSAEGAACLSAVRRARQDGVLKSESRVVVLLTGHASQWSGEEEGSVVEIDGYNDLRKEIGAWLQV